jgi:glycerol kinase
MTWLLVGLILYLYLCILAISEFLCMLHVPLQCITHSPSTMNVKVDEKVLQQDVRVVVGAIDQGTSSSRFLLFSQDGLIIISAQVEHKQIFPQVSWHEHDPAEIWSNCVDCIQAVVEKMAEKGFVVTCGDGGDKDKKGILVKLAAIGVTNQRETTVAWNRTTGKPYYNAIVWDDSRTTHIAHEIAAGDMNRLRAQTGLPVASYFAGTKVKWLLDNVVELRNDLANPETSAQVCFGTIDTWLVYQLTGSSPSGDSTAATNTGGIFVTDVTNASRWLFMDLEKQVWDKSLVDTVCAPHKLPISTALPKICPSSHVYGICRKECGVPALDQVPVASILGDQQAALFGQTAFHPGEAKNTYGTGIFLMMNTGTRAITSTHGLLTTVAYKIGVDGPVHYALEGSVSHSGSTIQWLRDQLNLIDSAEESETLARTTPDNQGLYLVPAFSGLFAPHWRSDARACIVGMSTSHNKGNICRAALEATAYQAKEVFDAIVADSGVSLKSLKVDGGATNNQFLMQFQADIINVPVIQPVVMETTCMGAAFAAGLAVGVWKNLEDISSLWAAAKIYEPQMEEVHRAKYWREWNKAVTKSLNWVEEEEEDDEDEFVDALSEPTSLRDRICSTPNGSRTTTLIVIVAALCLGFVLGRTRTRS